MNKIQKKNKRGQAMGGLVLMFIGIIVVVALLPDVFRNQEALRTTYTYTGQQTVAAASTAYWMTGQNLLSTPTVVNDSGAFNCANNVTFTDVAVNPTTGVQQIKMTTVATWVTTHCGPKLNVSYTYGPSGYVADSGGRTVAGLIGLFSVIALLAFVIYVWYRNNGGLFGM